MKRKTFTGALLLIALLLFTMAGCAMNADAVRLLDGRIQVDPGSNTAVFETAPAADDPQLAAFGFTAEQVQQQFSDGAILVIGFQGSTAFVRLYAAPSDGSVNFAAASDSAILEKAQTDRIPSYTGEPELFKKNQQIIFARIQYVYADKPFLVSSFTYTSDYFYEFRLLTEDVSLSESEIAAFDRIVAAAKVSTGYRNIGKLSVLNDLFAELAVASIIMLLLPLIIRIVGKKPVNKRTAYTLFGVLGILLFFAGYLARIQWGIGYYGVVSILMIPVAALIANYGDKKPEAAESAPEPAPEPPGEKAVNEAEKAVMDTLDWIETDDTKKKPAKKKTPADPAEKSTPKKTTKEPAADVLPKEGAPKPAKKQYKAKAAGDNAPADPAKKPAPKKTTKEPAADVPPKEAAPKPAKKQYKAKAADDNAPDRTEE